MKENLFSGAAQAVPALVIFLFFTPGSVLFSQQAVPGFVLDSSAIYATKLVHASHGD